MPIGEKNVKILAEVTTKFGEKTESCLVTNGYSLAGGKRASVGSGVAGGAESPSRRTSRRRCQIRPGCAGLQLFANFQRARDLGCIDASDNEQWRISPPPIAKSNAVAAPVKILGLAESSSTSSISSSSSSSGNGACSTEFRAEPTNPPTKTFTRGTGTDIVDKKVDGGTDTDIFENKVNGTDPLDNGTNGDLNSLK